jgi:hypothetical protein
LSTTISLQPGVHHLRFIVDGDIVLSNSLPFTVDFTNSLVNYIEVVPGGTPSASDPGAQIPHDFHTVPPQQLPIQVILDNANQDRTGQPPQALPPTPRLGPTYGSPPAVMTPEESLSKQPVVLIRKRYTTVIPQLFQDHDAGEHSEEFRRAMAAAEILPHPPSLPMMLNKSVLNQATPLKDDASVLAHPNHTQLNHLATSSIKHGVIATSATTRYKDKVCQVLAILSNVLIIVSS